MLCLLLAVVALSFAGYAHLQNRQDMNFDKGLGKEVTQQAEDSLLDIDFAALKERNPDTVGWIRLPGTIINYPVVQAEDNKTYLYKRFDGAATEYGTIFADHRSKIYAGNNIILYGHNQSYANPVKFSLLHKYLDESNYVHDHPVFEFYKAEGGIKRRYKVFSAFMLDTNNRADVNAVYRNVSDDDYANYIEMLRNRSSIQVEADLYENKQTIILSTCSNRSNDERAIVCLMED
ncbi:class B sortase [Peptococcus simiae]|uniref:class B sortase n=1 Tax=Peptococcus simiae TaxID=1643805 RepID=UPI00397ED8D8